MPHDHAINMSRNTSAASTKTLSANAAASDTLFQLECVLLFALDVVKGPYIHSCAPAHPSEAIRSFLQPQAAPASSSTVTASLAAGPSAARRGTPLPQSPPPPLKASATVLGGDMTTMPPAASHSAMAAASPNTNEASAAMGRSPSLGALSVGRGSGGSTAGSFSSSFVPALPPPTSPVLSRTPPQTAAVGASLSSESLLQHTARMPLLGQRPTSPQSIANRTDPAAGLAEPALSGVACGDPPSMSSSLVVQGRLVELSNLTAADETHSYAVGASGADRTVSGKNAVFAVSPNLRPSESQSTLPSPSPTAGSFALAATRSLGGGEALALGTRLGGSGEESTHTNDEHRCDPRIDAARTTEGRTYMDGGTLCTDNLATPATTTDGNFINSSSMAAASASTLLVDTPPPCAGRNGSASALGAASEECATTEGQRQLQHHHHLQHLFPPSPQVWTSLAPSVTVATRGAPLPATSATAAADNGRMIGYNDVFVPRSEFCRRVLWLYPAESGLLFLYYPEDIPGEHYQRKTLRYSLCLVFRVDHKQVTIGDGLLHQLVHPYSVVLTNIAEELREAEIKYAYMSRGLRSADSASWQMSNPALTSAIPSLATSATAALHSAAPSLVTPSMASSTVTAVAFDDVDESVGQAHMPTVPALPSSALHKSHTLLRGRAAGQSSAMAPSPFATTAAAVAAADALSTPSITSAHADWYHLIVSELGGTEATVAAAAGKDHRPHSVVEMADRTPTLFVPPRQPSTAFLAEETDDCGSTEATAATVSGDCSSQPFEKGAGGAQGRCDGVGGSLPPSTRRNGDASSLATRTAAASTMVHTRTLCPPSTVAHSCSASASMTTFAVDTGNLVIGGGLGDGSVRSSLMYLTNTETVDMAITPPSSVPLRSRTMGEAAAFFSLGHVAAPASVLSATLGGPASPYHSGIRHQHSTAVANTAKSPCVSSPYHSAATATAAASMGDSAAAGSGMHILNAFITPPTAPQWTPLSELVEELFYCLRHTSEAPDGNEDRERDAQMGSPTAGGRSPRTASPTFSGAAAGLAAQPPENTLSAGISSKALAQLPTPRAPAPPAGQQQRGDTSVVHLSNRLSFHVRRMAPLQPARLLHFDHVPVPIVAYDPAMMEWMDMAVHHVFQLVDGVRTVADLVFDVVMGTTTTLAEVYTDALQRSASERRDVSALRTPRVTSPGAAACSAQRSTAASRNRVRGAAVKGAASLSVAGAAVHAAEVHGSGESAAEAANATVRGASAARSPGPPVVVSVPIDVRPCPLLPPGVHCSIPTSAAGVISDGQATLPSHVNVRVTPAAARGASIPSAGVPVRSGASGVTPTAPFAPGLSDSSSGTAAGAFLPPPPDISMELPQTWVTTTGMVMEALLHLELCHLIKVYRPWTERTLYSATHSAQRVLCSVHHPARHAVAHYLLYMAWAEQQERREQRRRVIAEWKHRQKESVKAKREARWASKTSIINTPVVAERPRGSPPMGIVSPGQRSSTAAAVTSPSAPRPFTEPTAALAATPACGVGRKTTATNVGVSSKSPHYLIDRSDGRPAATLQLSTSAPHVSGLPHSGREGQLPHQPRLPAPAAYPESPSVPHSPHIDTQLMGSGGGAIHVAGMGPGSTGTDATSSVATSFAPSSLRHSLSVSASGRLQMTLTNSLVTLPLLLSSASGGGLLPCGSSPLRRHQSPHQHANAHPCLLAASLRSLSSTSVSNSASISRKSSCTSASSKSSSSVLSSVSSDSGSSSVSSSSLSSAASPLPVLPSDKQPLAGRSAADAIAAHTPTVPAKLEAPILSSLTASAAGANAPPQASKGVNAAIDRPTASARREAERRTTGVAASEALQRAARGRRCPPLKIFAPTEADVSRAAAAALCALAKFNNASVSSVQEEMRRIPVWATSFNHWSDRCVKALVEVALLNDWLEDVSQ